MDLFSEPEEPTARIGGVITELLGPSGKGHFEDYDRIIIDMDGDDKVVYYSWPEKIPFPFKIGDTFVMVKRYDLIQIHSTVQTSVHDGDGNLVFAASDYGDISFATGWNMEWGKANGEFDGGPGHREHEMVLTYRGKTVRSHGDWRTFELEERTWFVFALGQEAFDFHSQEPGDGPPLEMPCDYSPSYSMYTLFSCEGSFPGKGPDDREDDSEPSDLKAPPSFDVIDE